MKKLLLFHMFCLVYTISNAQAVPKKIEGKPDYKETVQFIKATMPYSIFNEGIKWLSLEYNCSYTVEVRIRKMDFLDECKLDIGYVVSGFRTKYHTRERYDEFSRYETELIDFSKIENIQVTIWESNGSERINGLFFKTFGKSEPLKIHIPIGIYDDRIQMSDSQIFKAFEHIRKMCGAPEPIKF